MYLKGNHLNCFTTYNRNRPLIKKNYYRQHVSALQKKIKATSAIKRSDEITILASGVFGNVVSHTHTDTH